MNKKETNWHTLAIGRLFLVFAVASREEPYWWYEEPYWWCKTTRGERRDQFASIARVTQYGDEQDDRRPLRPSTPS